LIDVTLLLLLLVVVVEVDGWGGGAAVLLGADATVLVVTLAPLLEPLPLLLKEYVTDAESVSAEAGLKRGARRACMWHGAAAGSRCSCRHCLLGLEVQGYEHTAWQHISAGLTT
jgi:hypothetical protein